MTNARNACTGKGRYRITLTPAQYTLEVKVSLTAKRNLQAVQEMLDEVVPANLVVLCSLLYNQHSTLARMAHAQLAGYTHEQLRNEVLDDG